MKQEWQMSRARNMIAAVNRRGKRRILIAAAGIFIVIALLFLSLAYPNIRRHFFGKKEKPRGEIFDCTGKPLAVNQSCYDICADPQDLPDAEAQKRLAGLAAEDFGSDPKRVLARLQRKYVRPDPGKPPIPCRYALIAKYVPAGPALTFRDKLRKLNLEQGVYIKENRKRYYPNNAVLASILGLVTLDDDKRGQCGIEAWIYHEEQEKNRLEKVFLTINLPMQKIIESEADKLAKEWSPRYLYAILVNPRNGNILAAVQRPGFNPNDRAVMAPDATRNFLFENKFRPGAMLIPLLVAEALDRGTVKADEKIPCAGDAWTFKGKSFRAPVPAAASTPLQIIADNSSLGAAGISLRLGSRQVHDSLLALGIGQSCGLPLFPEFISHLRNPDECDASAVARISAGYGYKVTSAQLVRAYCALADGGRLRNLRLIEAVKSYADEKVRRNPVSVPATALNDPETIRRVMNSFPRRADSSGRAFSGQNFSVPQDNPYTASRLAASIGFAPADNPEFVMLLIMDMRDEVKDNVPTAAATDRIMAQLLARSDLK